MLNVALVRLSLAAAAVLFATALWDVDSGLRLLRLRSAHAVLHDEVNALQQEVEQLQQQFVLLQQEGRSEASLDYLLHIARQEVGFVAPHERVLLLQHDDQAGATTP